MRRRLLPHRHPNRIVRRAAHRRHTHRVALCRARPRAARLHGPHRRHRTGRDRRRAPHEGDRRAAHRARQRPPARKHLLVAGRRVELRIDPLHQVLRPRDARHRLVPRHGALPHAGHLERHEDELPDARAGRLLAHPLVFRRRRLDLPRRQLRGYHRRRAGRCHHACHEGARDPRIRPAVRPGRRVVHHLRRVPPVELPRRAVERRDPRAGQHLGKRLPLPQLRLQAVRHQRQRRDRRRLLPPATKPQRRLPRPAPPARVLLHLAAGRPLLARRLVSRHRPRVGPPLLGPQHLARKAQLPDRTHAARRCRLGPALRSGEGRRARRVHLRRPALPDGVRSRRTGQLHPRDRRPEPHPHPLRPRRSRIRPERKVDVRSQRIGPPAPRQQRRPLAHRRHHGPPRRHALPPAAFRTLGLRLGQVAPHAAAGHRRRPALGTLRRPLDAPHPGTVRRLAAREARQRRPESLCGPQLPLPHAQRPLFPAGRESRSRPRTRLDLGRRRRIVAQKPPQLAAALGYGLRLAHRRLDPLDRNRQAGRLHPDQHPPRTQLRCRGKTRGIDRNPFGLASRLRRKHRLDPFGQPRRQVLRGRRVGRQAAGLHPGLVGGPHGPRGVAPLGARLQMAVVQRAFHHVGQRPRRAGPRPALHHERPLAGKKPRIPAARALGQGLHLQPLQRGVSVGARAPHAAAQRRRIHRYYA